MSCFQRKSKYVKLDVPVKCINPGDFWKISDRAQREGITYQQAVEKYGFYVYEKPRSESEGAEDYEPIPILIFCGILIIAIIIGIIYG